MKRFIEGEERGQVSLMPECLDDFIAEDNPVRIVDAFVEELELQGLGFVGAEPADTGRPSYHPAVCSRSTSTAILYGRLRRTSSLCVS
jgi:transposase